jgi:hypothetical protein
MYTGRAEGEVLRKLSSLLRFFDLTRQPPVETPENPPDAPVRSAVAGSGYGSCIGGDGVVNGVCGWRYCVSCREERRRRFLARRSPSSRVALSSNSDFGVGGRVLASANQTAEPSGGDQLAKLVAPPTNSGAPHG